MKCSHDVTHLRDIGGLMWCSSCERFIDERVASGNAGLIVFALLVVVGGILVAWFLGVLT